jgi:hypothetical protein
VTAAAHTPAQQEGDLTNTRTDEEANDTMEGEANRFAANQLIPDIYSPTSLV